MAQRSISLCRYRTAGCWRASPGDAPVASTRQQYGFWAIQVQRVIRQSPSIDRTWPPTTPDVARSEMPPMAPAWMTGMAAPPASAPPSRRPEIARNTRSGTARPSHRAGARTGPRSGAVMPRVPLEAPADTHGSIRPKLECRSGLWRCGSPRLAIAQIPGSRCGISPTRWASMRSDCPHPGETEAACRIPHSGSAPGRHERRLLADDRAAH